MTKEPRHLRSQTFNLRGIELADKGWLDEALREFSQAIDADSDSPFPRINRASVYLEKERHLDALEDLLEAVKLAPGEAATHYHLGVFLSRFGSKLAVGHLQQSLNRDPEQVDALLQLGTTLADRGETRSAEQHFRAALQIDPADATTNRELGVLLMERGEIHEAITHIKAASVALPGDTEIAIDLSMAYIQAGFYEKSEELLVEIIEGNPENLHANYNLAAIYADWDRLEKAMFHLKKAAESDFSRVKDWVDDDRMFDKLKKDITYRMFFEPASH